MSGGRSRAHLGLAVLSQAVASGGGFLTTLVLAKWLGLEEFGRVALVLLGAGFGAGLVQALGVQPFLSLGERARRPGRPQALILWTAGIAAAVGVLAAVLGPEWLGAGAFPAAFAASTRAASPAARALSFGTGRQRVAVAIDGIVGLGGLLGALLFGLVLGPSADAALLGLGSAAALGVACAVVLGNGARGAPPVGCGRRRTALALAHSWRRGRWLALTQALSWVGTGSVHVAAATVLGPSAVGALRAAQALVGAAGVLLQALELGLPRGAAEARASGALEAWTRAWCARAFCAMAAAGALLALCAGPLTRLVTAVPAEAALAHSALVVLAVIPAIAAVTGVVSVAFRAVGKTRAIAVAYAASAVFGAALAAPLVLRFGLPGAALGLALSQAVYAAGLALSWRAEISQKLVCVTTGHIGA